jgi:hypothetical protein
MIAGAFGSTSNFELFPAPEKATKLSGMITRRQALKQTFGFSAALLASRGSLAAVALPPHPTARPATT